MQTRHLHQLLSRLERVADVGCAEISFNEMMFWFDARPLHCDDLA